MYKVLIFAGTVEGRQIAEYLASEQVPVLVSVATAYGQQILEESFCSQSKPKSCMQITQGRLKQEEMETLMCQEGCELVIDATHPYAVAVSEHIQKACLKTGIPRIRLLRESETELSSDCVLVSSAEEAVEFLKQTSGTVLLTTGSKELAVYTQLPAFAKRLYPRFLPAPGAIEAALSLGYQPQNLICMQGPFSLEMNVAMLQQIQADWMVTKESGKAGGFAQKLEAAQKVGAKLIVIGRPCTETGLSMQEVLNELAKRFSLSGVGADSQKDFTDTSEAAFSSPFLKNEAETGEQVASSRRQVTLIGIGMGMPSNMTIEAYQDCLAADAILGAKRMLACCKDLHKPMFAAYRPDVLKQYLDDHPEYTKTVILLSGDIGFYSGAKKMIDYLEADYDVKIRNGISSVVYFCGKLKTSWEDVKLMSLHGKNQNLIGAVSRYRKVFSLIGEQNGAGEVCKLLTEYGWGEVKVSIGIRLSYPDETIITGTAKELAKQELGGLCVMLIENAQAGSFPVTHGIEDEAFIRGKVPMTKSEIRAISLSKLQLHENSILYDIGAGTGSVSIEAALQAVDGFVYAIEKKAEACALIEENKRKFHTANIEVVSGLAPEAFAGLPVPTHAFIGGSSGNMKRILEFLLRENPQSRIVINCIALESIAETLDCMKTLPVKEVDIMQISSARSRELGAYHMMTGMNPIFIVSCTGAGESADPERSI